MIDKWGWTVSTVEDSFCFFSVSSDVIPQYVTDFFFCLSLADETETAFILDVFFVTLIR